jgi:lipid-A-disaccharide synthase
LWAWAGWRVKKMRRTVNTVLTAMPFEDDWYRKRDVNTHYIGHPYFDEIRQQKLDSTFIEQYRNGEEIIGILPGSRNQEVQKNGPMMLRAARKIRDAKPGVRFLVASFNDRQANVIREMAQQQQIDLEIHVGRTPEIIELSKACIAVSGSVSLELFTRAKPAVIVYKTHELGRFLAREIFMQVPYISLPNLLAQEEIFPEYLTSLDQSTKIAKKIVDWLDNDLARQKVVNKLTDLREKYALPGAIERAAEYLVKTIDAQEHKFRSAA